MSDRELLELAAKAAGLLVQKKTEVVDADDRFIGIKVRATERDRYALWNPLNDDGHALRLVYALKLNVQPQKTMGGIPAGFNVWPAGRGDCAALEDGNTLQDLRRAIVRASAELQAPGAKPNPQPTKE